VQARESSLTTKSWLWAPPAKHSTRQLDELLERIELSYQLGAQHHLRDQPDDLLRRMHAPRIPSTIGRPLIVDPVDQLEGRVSCALACSRTPIGCC